MTTEDLELRVAGESVVPALWREPASARAALVLAHGAGAGMRHAFMAALADALATRAIATLRYEFPYAARGSRRPDPPATCRRVVRAAVERARALAPSLPLYAGGKSFGGRMSSQAQAEAPLPDVRGLVFFGFPLHPARRPSSERAAHLAAVAVPMLFLQGTRDALAEPALLQAVVADLGPRATLLAIDGADHAFHVSARSGRTDDDVLATLARACAEWMDRR